jgi:hypothetical protein
MKRRTCFAMLVMSLTVLMIPSIALADTIILNSDLSGNESNNISSGNVRILWPHPMWQPNGVDYFWISYADTGYPPSNAPTPNDPWPADATIPGKPTAIFYESFVLPYDSNTGSIKVWADDTTGVWIGGRSSGNQGYLWTSLVSANPVQGIYCADGPIGCVPGNGLSIDLTNLTAGLYTLKFDAYQRQSGPFGIMYTGSIDSQPVPEASSLILLATGLGLVGLIICRHRQIEPR